MRRCVFLQIFFFVFSLRGSNAWFNDKMKRWDTKLAAESSKKKQSSSPIPPPPSLSMPVWSLATPMRSDFGSSGATSMNIITYAMPVSVAPPKLWAVSLYHGTCTKDSFLENGRGFLQLLRPRQKDLVQVLGKHSSNDLDYSKQRELSLLGYEWVRYKESGEDGDFQVDLIPRCKIYVDLRIAQNTVMDAGDHVVVLCQAMGTYIWNEDQQSLTPLEQTGPLDHNDVLYSGLLRQEGLI